MMKVDAKTVVLTRPHPVHDGVMGELMGQGLVVLDAPTLNVVANVDVDFERMLSQAWARYDGVMFVSQHAVRFASERLVSLGLDWSPEVWAATVGGATAVAVQTMFPNASVILPESGAAQDSNGLWGAMQLYSFQKPLKSSRVLVVRAQTGRDFFLQQLVQTGATVDVWACYQRQALDWDAALRDAFKYALFDVGLVIAVTSSEGLAALLKNLTELSIEERLKLLSQPVVSFHPTIAQCAKDNGFEQVHICAPTEMAAVLARLARAF